MKKRIAAAAMAAVMMFCVLTDSCRVRAFALTSTAIACIGAAAITLTSVMFGVNYQEEIGDWMSDTYETVEEALEGLSTCCVGLKFVDNVVDIARDLFELYEADEITVTDGGAVELDYEIYMQLCELVTQSLPKEFTFPICDDICTFTPTSEDVSYYGVRILSSLEGVRYYTPFVFYEDNVYISDISMAFLRSDPIVSGSVQRISFATFETYSADYPMQYSDFNVGFNYVGSNAPVYIYSGKQTNEFYQIRTMNAGCQNTVSGIYDSMRIDYPVSSIKDYYFRTLDGSETLPAFQTADGINLHDLTDVNINFIDCGSIAPADILGTYDFTATDSTLVNDLSQPLDEVLVLNPNPGLVIDTDRDIAIPTDAVLVTSIPAVEDATLTDYMEKVPPRLDIDIPNTIITKFPFCLPFDLYKLMTIFVAEPEPPVIRIPISTDFDMSQFEGNQTFGESSGETFEPMFEINEEIVIDFTGIPFVQPICYTVFIVGFIFMLIMITTKLINH